jgi:hypothetical protein
MKSNPKHSPEYTNFENALRHVLSVPKAEVLAEIERQHKARKKRKPNASASGRASRGKG